MIHQIALVVEGSTAAFTVVREVLFVSAVAKARVNSKFAKAMEDVNIG